MGEHHNTTKALQLLAHCVLYEISHTLRMRTHGGFQTLDVEHRTDSKRPLDQPSDNTTGTDEDGDRRRRRRAKTETDEDGDGRRRRQTKTETVGDEDRLTPGTSEVAEVAAP